MNKHISITCDPKNPEKYSEVLSNAIDRGSWISLQSKEAKNQNINTKELPSGPGVIIKGGGSTGKYIQCLHLCSHLDQSALATGQWLERQGIDPRKCYVFNPLPLHHVSGLLPWWRSRCWGVTHEWVTPNSIRNPVALEERSKSLLKIDLKPIITSLVPTQLHRLLQSQSGIRWLQLCTIVWIGGSALSTRLAGKARDLKIRLAPCYGTTETAAMITAQTPKEFLCGNDFLGAPLNDIELRLGENNSLQVRTKRLAKALLDDGSLKSIHDPNGWWESGDIASLSCNDQTQQLKIIGRKDTAINSGGEIIFPEVLQAKLIATAQQKGIPIKTILLTPVKDEEWGRRLVALVKLQGQKATLETEDSFLKLKQIVNEWHSFERPVAWYNCPELEKNELGKWEVKRWQTWATLKRANTTIDS